MGICRFAPDVTSKERVEDVYLGLVRIYQRSQENSQKRAGHENQKSTKRSQRIKAEARKVKPQSNPEDESAPTDGQFFYDDEGIDTVYEFEYDVQSSKDAGTYDDDDVDEYFLVDEENEILEPDVDVYLFHTSMDLPFDNIGITVDVINVDGFENNPGNDEERKYRKRRLAELRTEMEDVINASGQLKYSFYTGQKFTTPKEAKDKVYLHSIKSRRNLKLYKNDGVRIRARCDGKVLVFTMSQWPKLWNGSWA
ncbi:hypothetical protein Tco_0291340 [Tanacetum coccineum]